MSLTNTRDSYGSVAKFFHWIMALLIISLLGIGLFMGDINSKNLHNQVYNLHKLFGLLVLLLAVLRLLWRWTNTVPALPIATPYWEKFLEKTVKFLLYVSLFALPISGWIFSTAGGHAPYLGSFSLAMPYIKPSANLQHFFHSVHSFLGWTVIALLSLHIAGALKHHFINKTNVLRRIMPTRSK